jgi:predicted amidophosphoribosyltransferase
MSNICHCAQCEEPDDAGVGECTSCGDWTPNTFNICDDCHDALTEDAENAKREMLREFDLERMRGLDPV